MDRERQKRAPIYEALEAFKKKRVVPFDVPGHKRGRGNPELVQLLGEKCVSLDVNSMKPLDNSMPSHFCDPGGGGAGRGRLWSGGGVSDGGRNHFGGPEHDPLGLRGRRQDHPAPERP